MSFVKWIKVSDSTPNDNSGCRNGVLFSDGKYIYFGDFIDGEFCTCEGDAGDVECHKNITHWFWPELPE